MSILHGRLPRPQQGLVLVLVVFLAACSSASSGPTPGQGSPVSATPSVVPASIVPASIVPTICASPCSVIMVERAYQPRTLNIKVGTEVIWSNAACDGCTVTFYSGISLDSGPMAIGASLKHTFSAAGVFAFRCQLDPKVMMGTIIVTN